MGNTSISVLNMLFEYTKNSVLMRNALRPTGKICKLQRPGNSELEDIVIDPLANVKDDVDEGVLVINIYVPNLDYSKIQGHPMQSDKSQPNTKRLGELSELANEAFEDGEDIWDESGEWCFKLQQDGVYADTNNQHYLNLRIEFYSIN
ncbi:hypothetical protein N180_02760 [Pedobacter antarcticus 4BY]|uniref:Uncharacterized protein n=3 Tax=Pedobacter antarcticus TaxID=34086 RepID=A0A081PKG3_9SPHI|nr:hypothetical protein N180_02760 [Pedobacter antarcticus 4BY]SFE54324.1 hypothetical protein SAMN03003324_00840 [Pedobacter antarcticus]